MSIYIGLGAVVVFLAYVAGEQKKKSLKDGNINWKVILCCLVVIFTVVSGIRGVGADYGNYMRLYHNQKNLTFSKFFDAFISFRDSLYLVICWLSSLIHDKAITMFFISAVISIVPVLVVTYRETDDIGFATILYLTLVWVDSFGAIRQAMAAAIIVLAYGALKRKKFIRYLLLVLLASQLHVTALIMIPVYFVLTRKSDLKNLVLIAVSAVVIRFSYDFIFDLMNAYKGKDITEYEYMTSEVNFLRVLVAFAPIVLFLFIQKRKVKELTGVELSDSARKDYIPLDLAKNIVLLNAAFMFATSNSTYLARVGIYLVPFFPIAITEIMKYYNKFDKRVMIAIMTVLYAIYWLYGINAQGLEYRFYFQRGGI